MKQPLLVLTGPTAVGKTKLSIALAKAIGGEIISADSMQVYRHMDIGSAKITPSEMDGVPHYLVDVLEPDEDISYCKISTDGKRSHVSDLCKWTYSYFGRWNRILHPGSYKRY